MKKLQWRSPTPYNKGSDAQKQVAAEQAAFYKTLTADYATQFANQSAILSFLKTAFEPILAGGIGQYGFTPTEDASIRTTALDAIATNFSNAEVALNEKLAAEGGGNVFIPSGGEAQLKAALLGAEATQQAGASNEITQKGYDVGRNNFLTASGVLGSTAGMYNPIGFAGAGNTAGQNAFSSATQLYEQGNWWGPLGGILGGAASSFLGGFGKGVGEGVGQGASAGEG